MTEQYEPSYYEIALTGRQVLAAFVILLVCMVAAFFSGVWVGRDGAAEAPAEVAERTGAETAEPAEETARLEELSFFEDDEGGEAGARSRDEPGRRPEAQEPRSGGAGDRADDRNPDGPAGDGAAEPTAERDPAPSPASDDEPEPAPPAAPRPSLSSGDVVIQVFSSSDREKAEEILERLRSTDFRAFISPIDDQGRTLYRVRVGPFEHKSDAERIATRLRDRLDLETWITQ